MQIIQIFGFPGFLLFLSSEPTFCHFSVDEHLQLRRGENRHDIQWQTQQSVLIVSLLV